MLDLRRPLCDSQCLRSRKSHTLHPTSTFQRFQRPSSPESLPRRASCHPLTTPPKTTQTFPRSPQPHSSPPPKIPTPTNRHRYPHHPQPQRDLTLITPSLPRPSAPHPPRSPPPHPIPPLPRPRPHPRLRRRHPGRQKPHAGPRARVVRARRRCWFGWRVGRRGRRRRKRSRRGGRALGSVVVLGRRVRRVPRARRRVRRSFPRAELEAVEARHAVPVRFQILSRVFFQDLNRACVLRLRGLERWGGGGGVGCCCCGCCCGCCSGEGVERRGGGVWGWGRGAGG